MRRLASIKAGEIIDLAKRLKPDCKASTRNRHVIVPARAVINFAAERGLCPHIKVKLFKEAKVHKVAVDRAWIDAFMHTPHTGIWQLWRFSCSRPARESMKRCALHLTMWTSTP